MVPQPAQGFDIALVEKGLVRAPAGIGDRQVHQAGIIGWKRYTLGFGHHELGFSRSTGFIEIIG